VINPTLAEMATYPFVRLEEARRRLVAEGVEVIDFGKGDPNEPTDPMIRQALVDALPERAPYPLAQGLPELREAAAAWCLRRFGVDVDPGTEIVPTYGSKEAIFSLAQVLDSAERTVVFGEPRIRSTSAAPSSPARKCTRCHSYERTASCPTSMRSRTTPRSSG
jgi:acetylornithine aminotransferase